MNEKDSLVEKLGYVDDSKTKQIYELGRAIQTCKELIEKYYRNYKYITQFKDSSIVLHNNINPYEGFGKFIDSGLKCARGNLGLINKTLQRTLLLDEEKIKYISLDCVGLITIEYKTQEELTPPQKHRKMINEWIESSGKKVVQQLQHDNHGKEIWTDDSRPTWLAEEYRFKYEMIKVNYCILLENCDQSLNLKLVYHVDEKYIDMITVKLKNGIETRLLSTQSLSEYMNMYNYILRGDGFLYISVEDLVLMYNSGKLKSDLIELKLK